VIALFFGIKPIKAAILANKILKTVISACFKVNYSGLTYSYVGDISP
jgi:hypothetical protein